MKTTESGTKKDRLLLAIICCHHRAWATDTIREFWVPDIKDRFDYKFFYGAGSHGVLKDDEVILGGDDAYRGLAPKVQAAIKWTLATGYEKFFKIDDDGVWIANRLIKAVEKDWVSHDYVGRMNGHTDRYHECTYARGGTGYYLSKPAMEYIATRPIPDPTNPKDYAEDSFIGRHLEEGGFVGVNDGRLRCASGSGPNRSPRPNGFQGWKTDCPTMHNDVITVCEFLGSEQRPVYEEWVKTREKFEGLMGRLRIQ